MDYVEQFLEALVAERGLALNSIAAYKKDLEDFYLFLDKVCKKFTEVEKLHMQDFAVFLKKEKQRKKQDLAVLFVVRDYFYVFPTVL